MIYFACYDLSKKDKETMLKSIQKPHYRKVLNNMGLIDERITDSEKFCRRAPLMTEDEFNIYAQKHTKAKYDIIQCEPVVCKLLR
jgi:hypothetical protein